MASTGKVSSALSGSAVSVVGSRPRYINLWIWFSYVVLTVGIVVAIAPFFWMVSASLMTLGEATGRAVLPAAPQWINYQEAWVGGKFSQYFINSVRITSITIVGQVVFCTLAAYAFASMEFPGKGFLFSLLLTTLMLPEAVTRVPNFITVTWLGRIGPIPWINSEALDHAGYGEVAFNIFLLHQFFAQMPEDLWGQIDGAGICVICAGVRRSHAALVTVIIFGFDRVVERPGMADAGHKLRCTAPILAGAALPGRRGFVRSLADGGAVMRSRDSDPVSIFASSSRRDRHLRFEGVVTVLSIESIIRRTKGGDGRRGSLVRTLAGCRQPNDMISAGGEQN